MAEASGTRDLLEEDTTDTFCVSCIEIGYLKAAETYCVDSGKYLCNGCVEKHRREESSKKQERVILTSSDDIDDKPDECVERCVIHVKQVMQYYCEDHQKLCCTDCIMLEHTTCSKTYIPTASKNIFKSQEYREFKADIQGFIKDGHDNQKKLDKTLEITRQDAFDKLDEIRRQRQSVNAYFDKIEENLKRQCRQAYTDDENHLDEVIKENKKLLDDLNKMHVEMTATEQNHQKCQVYVKLKQWQDIPTQYTQKLADIRASDRVHNYRFEPSDYFKEQDNKYIGHLVYQTQIVNVKHNSETTCDISDIAVLPNGTIALADNKNGCVKVMHPSRLRVTSKLIYHTSEPVGLAKSSVNQFAVSSRYCKIKVIELSPQKLTLVHELYIPKPGVFLKSLCYTEKGLMIGLFGTTQFKYVSDTPPVFKLNIGSTSGYFATCSRNETIYRTVKIQYLFSIVTEMIHQTLNGDILSQYEHKLLPSPCGVAVSSNGTVYVCDDETNTIHILTPDLTLLKILKVDFGEAKPRSLAVCNKFELLYVCTDKEFICILRLPHLMQVGKG